MLIPLAPGQVKSVIIVSKSMVLQKILRSCLLPLLETKTKAVKAATLESVAEMSLGITRMRHPPILKSSAEPKRQQKLTSPGISRRMMCRYRINL
mmetsp:Transcript_2406/g.4451  ORF Transcript_2406/g.4451 Transcript_2406/m.4451 type:complete len:95 (+) Transcript_2406:645-929(+)